MEYNILVVEDNFIIQMFIEEILIGIGNTKVRTAGSGKEALKRLEEEKPDLIFMDIGIGKGLDGIQVTEIVNEKYRVPVVYLTGNSDISTLERAKNTNPIHVIFKPIDEGKLLNEFKVITQKMVDYYNQFESRKTL
ncbi:response regulator [Cellulophaga baltica]|uniref:response regulator n=1 Tax=Cellulophaga TaxID=104264 RepID=UPI001C07502D|nr:MULTISPECIES: response regulator [Cellulophaga]MBU2997346.1 response regulator [Cellulophaga baltica]MDO6768744.1 response regulator [Cellulophaga sp. 1_MG-2023]